MKRIAIFASGSGTNAENIILYFKNSNSIKIELIVSNKKDAFVLNRSQNHGIKSLYFNRSEFYDKSLLLNRLNEYSIDFIVLAGFLWLIPKELIDKYPKRIINIHPALLPNYGGKGMYGMKVHEAIIEAGEKESGITIHFVNENYDEGENIFQAKCEITSDDDAESLANKIHALEYAHFPAIIEKTVLG
jgi:phosphoribosylglycinamide formyltransferase-1